MSSEFNPFEYRQDLAKQIKTARQAAAQHVHEAEASGSMSRVWHAKDTAFQMARQPLKLARWNEAYHRARLLVHGQYITTPDGEMRQERSGLSTKELADIAKLKDYLDTNFDDVLKILPSLKIPPEQFQTEEVKAAASQLLWMECAYGAGLTSENAKVIQDFVRLFGLEEELYRAISERLDDAIKGGRRSQAEALLAAYPVMDVAEIDKRLRGRFYPMPKGLKEQEQPPTFFDNLLERPEAAIPADIVARTIAQHAAPLAQDILKDPDLYWMIKRQLLSGDDRSWSEGRWIIRSDRPSRREEKERVRLHVEFLLGDTLDAVHSRKRGEGTLHDPRLEFHFSCDADDVWREARYSDRYFTTTNIFQYDGVYLGTKRPNRFALNAEDRPWVRLDEKEPDLSPLASLTVQKSAIQELTSQLFAPERDFHRSIDALRMLTERHSLPKEQVNDLITAIKEFGTYMYRKKSSDVGDCLTTPNTFEGFCEYKFGIKLESARYGEYHPEWGSDMGYDPYTFFHQVSTYANRLVIDWTATQYAKFADEPIPYIYEIGAERGKMGPLYKRFGDKPNTLFIDNPDDPLYREEPEVCYGI